MNKTYKHYDVTQINAWVNTKKTNNNNNCEFGCEFILNVIK